MKTLKDIKKTFSLSREVVKKLAKIKVSDDNDCVKPKLLFNCYNIDSFG